MIRITMIDATTFRVGEVADVRTGHPFRGAIPEVADGPVAVVQMRDLMSNGVMDWEGVQRTQLETRKEPDWLQAGDVLFAARGPSNYAGVLGTVPLPAVCSPHLQLLRVRDTQQVLPAFLAWQINQLPAQKYFWQAAEGSAQLSVRRSLLEALSIVIPPLKTQHLIVALAATFDQERELMYSLLSNRSRQMEAIAASLLTPKTNQTISP